MSTEIIGRRWSGADWSTEQKDIIVVGQGGIGSWLTLALSRIEHRLFTIDPDSVDTTNIEGGQMFRRKDVNRNKAIAVSEICREFGCVNSITPVDDYFTEETGTLPIMIGAVDSMKARKLIFQEWRKKLDGQSDKESFLLLDGRLNLEDYEILCVQGNNPEQIEQYERDYLFNDEDVPDTDCTSKQTTYTAMGIASFMTAILCNWLTNKKLDMQVREIPFHTRIYYPGMLLNVNEAKLEEELVL